MRARRIPLVILVLTLLFPTALAGAGENPTIDQYRDAGSSILESGVVAAIPNVRRDVSDFIRPMDPEPTSVDTSGARITGTGAVTLTATGTDFSELTAMDTVTGDDGEYLTRIGFDIRNFGDTTFYNTRTSATLYLAEFSGEPEAPQEGVFGVSFGFTWAGEEVLTSSFFPNDPLLGYAHSVEYGEVAGVPFDHYSSVQEQEWTQYSNPLLTFGGPIIRDNTFWFGWLVPGVPEKGAVTLSYATNPSDPNTLISQQLEFSFPERIEYSALEFEFGSLSAEEQQALESRWSLVLAGTGDAGGGTEETTTSSTATTTTTLGGSQADGPGDTDGSSSFRTVWWVLGTIGALFLIGFLSAWLTGRPGFLLAMLPGSAPHKRQTGSGEEPAHDGGPPKIDWGGPPGSEVEIEDDTTDPATDWQAVRTAKGAENEAVTAEIITSHERDGGGVLGGEWVAPSEEAVIRAKYGRGGSATGEWSGIFINIRSGEWVEEPDPLHRELKRRFGIDPEPIDIGGTPVL